MVAEPRQFWAQGLLLEGTPVRCSVATRLRKLSILLLARLPTSIDSAVITVAEHGDNLLWSSVWETKCQPSADVGDVLGRWLTVDRQKNRRSRSPTGLLHMTI